MYGNNKKSKAAKGTGKGMPIKVKTGTVNKPMTGKAPVGKKRVTSKRIY